MIHPPRLRATVFVALVVVAIGLVIRFPGALPGPGVVSAMDHLSVHPLFQEAGSEDRGRVNHPHLSDPALQLAALDLRTVASLREGRIPLWNPDLYGGAPLLGDGQSRPFSPVTLLKVLLPQHPAMASDLGIAWLFAWCTLGFTLLARRVWAAPLPALGVAAATVVTTPYLSVWLLHPHASTFVWLPWCLLAVERGRAPGMALAVAGLWTGGHPGTTLHVAGTTGLWWLVRSRRPGPMVGAVVGLGLAAPSWAPLWEQVTRSTTATARVGGTLDPALLLDLLWPGFHGHPARESWSGSGSWADGQLHPGPVALLLAVWSLLQRGPGWKGRIALAALILGATLASVTGLPGPVAHGRLGSFMSVFWSLLAAAGTIRLAHQHPRRAWVVAMLVLLTGTAIRHSDQHSLPIEEYAHPPAEWVRALTEAQGDGRILGIGWAAQPNTGALAGLRDLRGYDLPVSETTHALMGSLSPRPRGPWYPVDTLPDPGWLQWWDVRVVVAFPETVDPSPLTTAGWTPIELPPGAPLVAWKAPSPHRSAWLVSRSRRVADVRGAQAAISADPTTAPVFSADLVRTGEAPPVAAAREWDGDSRMRLTFPAVDHDTLLVVAEAWAPGWRALLSDGSHAAPALLGTLSMGIPIPAGVDSVALYYRPDGWIRGQQLGAAGGLALLLLLGVPLWRRSRRRDPEGSGSSSAPTGTGHNADGRKEQSPHRKHGEDQGGQTRGPR